MAKTKISEFSSTPGNNTDIDSINLAEGCAPSGINDAIRELMAQLKDFQTGAVGDSFNGPVGTTTAAAGAFTTLTASSTATLNTLASSGATLTGGTINGMAIGGTTAAAVSATTLTTSSTVTLNGGTANGVAYLNGSKVLTTGSALTFDGTSLGVSQTTASGLKITGFNSSYGASTQYFNGGATTNGFTVGQGYATGTDNTAFLLNAANAPIVFGVNATEQMRLTSTGLGIGTSSPGEKLTVWGGGGTSSTVNFTGGSIGNDNATISSDYSLNFQVDANNNIGGRDFNWRYGGKGYSDGTLLMTLNSSGNLGLGVTPSAGGSVYYKSFELGKAGCGLFAATNSLTGSELTYLAGNAVLTYSAGPLWLYGNNGNAASLGIEDGAFLWRQAGSGTAGNAISFTQAMSLTAAGDLLVGTTSAGGKVSINSIGGSQGTSLFINGWGSGIGSGAVFTAANTSNSDAIYFNTSATNVGKIAITSTATSYVTSSDYRLKENIAPMTGALAKVAALKPVTYTWKADGSAGEGFIAHELAKDCPQAVTGEKDAVDAEGNPRYQGIDVSFLVGTLTAAIQEQQAIIEDMKTRLAAAGI